MYFLWLYGSFKPLFTNIWLYALMSLARVGQSMMFWTSTNCNTCQHFFEKILNLCRLFCHRLLLSNIGYYICFKKQLCHTLSFEPRDPFALFELPYWDFHQIILHKTGNYSQYLVVFAEKMDPIQRWWSSHIYLFA